jgi:hypothetical protein
MHDHLSGLDPKSKLLEDIQAGRLGNRPYSFDPRSIPQMTRSKRYSNLAALKARFARQMGVR